VYVAMHFAAAAQVLLLVELSVFSCQFSAVSRRRRPLKTED
jgi:hypothetical protein